MTYSKKAFIYFMTKAFGKQILCALVSHPETRNSKITSISYDDNEKQHA